ncbi:hypothetical protein SAMN05192551_103137 [Tindallia magadiensis]|uniref:ABC transporter transmembrane region n=1 Tax=Tindallia magadiensis TaxID=69895 RepID=A0A1I3D3W7_9FIRM|nr:hypothetical protein [Tindallia magadiensis]SFH81356.1 hypothetical protein SAMN05192551_103137 [Tindallia magadiensis]
MKPIKKYLDFFRWMISDSLMRYSKRVIIISLTDFLGVTMQVAALGVVLQYIRSLESGRPVSFFGYSVIAQESFGIFLSFASVSFFLLLISAWMIYYSDVQKFKLRVSFDEYCSKRAILKYSNDWLFSPELLKKERAGQDIDVSKVATGDARFYSRALFMTLNLLKPAYYFLIAVPAMLYISLGLTLILGLIISVSLFYQYKVSKNAAKQSMLLEKYNQEAGVERKKLLSFIDLNVLSNTTHYRKEMENAVERTFQSKAITSRYKALEERLKGAPQSTLVSNILMAVGIFVILIIFIGQSLLYEPQWAITIAYLVAIKVALNQLSRVNRILTGINRFYPQISRYRRFVCNDSYLSFNNKLTPEDNRIDETEIENTNSRADDKFRKALIMPSYLEEGTVIGVYYGEKLTKKTANKVISMLTENALPKSSEMLNEYRIVSSHYPLIDNNLLKTIGIWNEHKNWVEHIQGSINSVESMPEEIYGLFEEKMNDQKWNSIPPKIKLLVAIVGAIISNERVVVISEKSISLLTDDTWNQVIEALNEKNVILYYDNPQNMIKGYQESYQVIIGESEIASIIDPTDSEEKEYLRKVVQDMVKSSKRGLNWAEEDEDEDDAE